MEQIKTSSESEKRLTADQIEKMSDEAQNSMVELRESMASDKPDYRRAQELYATIRNSADAIARELGRADSELSGLFKGLIPYDILNIDEKELSIIAEKIKRFGA